MAKTALQCARERAEIHGIKIGMTEDFVRDVIVVRGHLDHIVCDHHINRYEILSIRMEDMDLVYARAYNYVIDQLLREAGKGTDMNAKLAELERELSKYKDAVKHLSFQLEMTERGGNGVLLKEDEVRRLALEQAAEHLMDHGVVTTGNELVAVCEQIKKLRRSEVRV